MISYCIGEMRNIGMSQLGNPNEWVEEECVSGGNIKDLRPVFPARKSILSREMEQVSRLFLLRGDVSRNLTKL